MIAFWAVLVASCSGQDGAVSVSGVVYDTEQIEAGRQLYLQYCASCHGVNGEGQFPDFPLLPDETGRFGAPPHNANGHTSHHPDDWLLQYVREGGISLRNPEIYYPMPAFGNQLPDERIRLVIAFIKTLWEER